MTNTMKTKLIFGALVIGLLAGCGHSGSRASSNEATLVDLNRAVAAVSMKNGGVPPQTLDAITNFLSLQNLRLPTPPAGKKLVIEADGKVVFADQ